MREDTAEVRLGVAGRLVAGVLGAALLVGGLGGMAYAIVIGEWMDAFLLMFVVLLGGAGVRAAWRGRTPLAPSM